MESHAILYSKRQTQLDLPPCLKTHCATYEERFFSCCTLVLALALALALSLVGVQVLILVHVVDVVHVRATTVVQEQ